MYYAEKVINGVMHYRTNPFGKWIPMTKIQLTEKLLRAQATTGRVAVAAVENILRF